MKPPVFWNKAVAIDQWWWGSPGLKVKFKLSLSPKANIIMYIHIHGDI